MSNVKLVNVNKIYPNGTQAVFDFNIDIKDGEFIVFVGPSGCGKTTTLRMIAGLEDISSGRLFIDDEFANNLTPKERNISMVFQSYALYPHMTIAENIGFALELRGYMYEEVEKKVRETAEILELTEYLNKKPKVLSGGQRQRVALGRAIARNASVFLLDEPLSNLDAKLRVQMRIELIALHKKIKSTFIYVTHDQIEAMTMADRIVVMSMGYIQQIGTPKEVYDNPENIFVGGFIGTPPMNFINGIVDSNSDFVFSGHKIRLAEEKFQIVKENNLIGKEIILGIRPEYITPLFIDDATSISVIPTNIEMLGSETNVIFKIDEQQLIANFESTFKVKKGEPILLYFNTCKIHLFDKATTKRLRTVEDEKINYLKHTILYFSSYKKNQSLTYEDSLLLITSLRYYKLTNDPLFLDFVVKYFDKAIDEAGNIHGYNVDEYNLDNLLSGNALLEVYEITKIEKFKKAIDTLTFQLKTQPRCQNLSFWHKGKYPNQIWLDGLYMSQKFYLETIADEKDSLNQFMNVRELLFDEDKKLYYHAYDETKTMQWANNLTGKSPNFWSRSVGWYLMALVDCYPLFNDKNKQVIGRLYKEALEGILPYIQNEEHMLYQIIDNIGLENNYPETSGSAMLAYSILKAYREGIIEKNYTAIAEQILNGIDNKYLSYFNSEYKLAGICKVAGLDNEKRDGSIAYYLSEPKSTNEIKGLAPYLMAYLELITIQKEK